MEKITKTHGDKDGFNTDVYYLLTTDYGTDRQATALMKWESKAETLERMLNDMDDNTL